MTAVQYEQFASGACTQLPLAVVDKYFMANSRTEHFQHLTAKIMCGRCAVRAMCLVDAIQLPTSDGAIRGGEAGHSINQLHRRYLAGEASAEALAAEALLKQRLDPTLPGHRDLRAGRMANATTLRTNPSHEERR